MSRIAQVFWALVVILISANAASAHPDTRSMTCAQVVALIKQQGGIVLSTGPHTYDRYVSSFSYCPTPTRPWQIYVPTSDERRCVVENCQQIDLFRRG